MASKVVIFRGPAASGTDMIIQGTRVPCTGGAFYVPEKLVKSFTALPQIATALKAGKLKKIREAPPAKETTKEEVTETVAEPASPAARTRKKRE